MVIFDDRKESKTKNELMEIIVGENNYALIRIPPMVWYGFKGEANDFSLIANCTSMTFNENEVERRNEINDSFTWL